VSTPSAAERRAITVLKELGIEEAPTPVEDIARRLGAQITYDSFEGDISGMLYREDDTAVIGVNSRHATTRQRFTVAHECGHLLLHKGQPMFIDRYVRVNLRSGESNKEEREANAFAAELLMPRALVPVEIERIIARFGQPPLSTIVAELARRFRVSEEAMTYRLTNLGMLDPYLLAG
jgi:Zn-dependent peptidase ImmA (M78 family)